MTSKIDHVRVFVASPSDVGEERRRVSTIAEELAAPFEKKGVVLSIKKWETHTTSAGGRPQQVINDQIGDYDIFIGIMWKRFGQPTAMAGSGTEEEFRIALDRWQSAPAGAARPHIGFFFRTSGPLPSNAAELEEYGRVLAFRERIGSHVLYLTYDSLDEFSKRIRQLLIEIVDETAARAKAPLATDEMGHPPSAGDRRGKRHSCTFFILDDYREMNNWEELGDVLVEVKNLRGAGRIFLIPSDNAPPLVREAKTLRKNKTALDLKREATQRFVEAHEHEPLRGEYFDQSGAKGHSIKVYCEAYDRFLADYLRAQRKPS